MCVSVNFFFHRVSREEGRVVVEGTGREGGRSNTMFNACAVKLKSCFIVDYCHNL